MTEVEKEVARGRSRDLYADLALKSSICQVGSEKNNIPGFSDGETELRGIDLLF